jgi:hypothetical protein
MGGGARFGGGAPGGGMRVGGGPGVVGGGVAPAARFAGTQAAVAPGVRVGGGTWNGGRTAWNGGNWHGGNWNGGWRGHRGWYPGAVAAGAVVGGALAANAYYGDPYYDDTYYDNGYYDDGTAVAVVPAEGGDASYCAQRYRSYDPASGTYLGYDGLRHPCP